MTNKKQPESDVLLAENKPTPANRIGKNNNNNNNNEQDRRCLFRVPKQFPSKVLTISDCEMQFGVKAGVTVGVVVVVVVVVVVGLIALY